MHGACLPLVGYNQHFLVAFEADNLLPLRVKNPNRPSCK
jgi:hypothetical protein